MESHAMRFIFSFAVLFSAVYATTPCDFPAIYNFGDSNSDTGELSVAFGALPPPIGESYFGGPAGRYSDGRLIIDFIAESLGIPYLNAHLDSVGSNFSHGANFATIQSTIRRPTTTYFQTGASPFPFNVQFYQFFDFRQRSQRFRNVNGVFRGLLPKPEDFSRALYTIDIGHNDVSGLFSMSKDELTKNVTDILDSFKGVFTDIYGNGARSFWIHNVGPIGCYATYMDTREDTTEQVDNAGCAVHLNEVVQYYNRRFKEMVVQLRKDLPSAAITYVDIYTVKYTLFSQGKEHGFENPLRVCCGYGGGKYNYNGNVFCGKTGTVNGKEVYAGKCKDPSASINWDGVHLTEAANKWVFDQIVNGSFSDPPVPLKMACHRHN